MPSRGKAWRPLRGAVCLLAWLGAQGMSGGSPWGQAAAPHFSGRGARAQGSRSGPGPLPRPPSSGQRLARTAPTASPIRPPAALSASRCDCRMPQPPLSWSRVVPAARVRPAWGGLRGWGGCQARRALGFGDGDPAAVGLAVAAGGDLGGPGPAHRLQARPPPFVGGGRPGRGAVSPGRVGPQQQQPPGWTEPRGEGGCGGRALSSCQPLGWAVGGTLAPWAGWSGGHQAPHLGAWGGTWPGRLGGRQPAVSRELLPAAHPGPPVPWARWAPGTPVQPAARADSGRRGFGLLCDGD